MTHRNKIVLLSILIMTGVALAVGGVSFLGLYRAGYEQQRERLIDIVQSRVEFARVGAQHLR